MSDTLLHLRENNESMFFGEKNTVRSRDLGLSASCSYCLEPLNSQLKTIKHT